MSTIDRISSARDSDLDRVEEGPPSAPPARPQPRPSVIVAVVALVTFVVLCLRNRYVFSRPLYEDGDFAANAIVIHRAMHLRQLVGHYSRVGFHHPGPAFLYVQAAGQLLFYRLTHLLPAPYNGQLLAVFVLNGIVIGLVVSIFYRHTKSLLITASVYAVVLAFVGHHLTLSSSWMPHLFYAPFLLFTVAGASIASDGLADIASFVFAGGLLVHGHVSFIEFVLVGTAVVGLTWVWRWRRDWRAQLVEYRRQLVFAGLLLALFLLPMVLNIVLHYPGEWGKYWLYVRSGSKPNALGPSIHYLMGFWAKRPKSGALLALTGLIGVALTAREKDPSRRRFFACALGGVAVMSTLFLVYAIRGVDDLSQSYIGIFYMSMPLLLVAVAAAAASSTIEGDGIHTLRPLRTLVATSLVAAPLVFGVVGSRLTSPYRGDSDLPSAVSAVKSDSQRAGRPVAIVFPHDEWPQVVGFVVEASRSGLTSCVSDPYWNFMFTSDFVCRPAEAASAWQLRIDFPGPIPAGARTVWSDSLMVVTAANG